MFCLLDCDYDHFWCNLVNMTAFPKEALQNCCKLVESSREFSWISGKYMALLYCIQNCFQLDTDQILASQHHMIFQAVENCCHTFANSVCDHACILLIEIIILLTLKKVLNSWLMLMIKPTFQRIDNFRSNRFRICCFKIN